MPISQAREFLISLALPPNDSAATCCAARSWPGCAISARSGVGYLTLDRSTRTLSGGEVQRVNLTTCLGASLVNTLFVMDEPSVGLHPRDVGRLVRVMHDLRDKGNTLLVVEHEEAIIRAADHLLDIGPGRGEKGGELVFQGTLAQMLGSARVPGAGDGVPPSRTFPNAVPSRKSSSPRDAATRTRDACATQASSLTAEYLSGRKRIPIPKSRRKSSTALKIKGASQHNLKNIDVEIPLGVFTCVTGVSGSGKSTLIHEVLYQNLLRARGSGSEEAGACKSVTGAHRVGEIVMVDQAPLSRTPRSTPDSLPRDLRSRARAFRRATRSDGAGSDGERLFLQLRERPLRTLRRHRLRENRDAIPERSLRPLRGMRRAPLSAARAEGETGRPLDSRPARADRERGGGIFYRARRSGPARAAALIPGGSRARLSAPRAAAEHAVRRRIAAAQTRQASGRRR